MALWPYGLGSVNHIISKKKVDDTMIKNMNMEDESFAQYSLTQKASSTDKTDFQILNTQPDRTKNLSKEKRLSIGRSIIEKFQTIPKQKAEHLQDIDMELENFTLNATSTKSNVEKKPSSGKWFNPGELAIIQGFNITCGMIYVGTELKNFENTYYHHRDDDALINPKLSVQKNNDNYHAFPSLYIFSFAYSQLTPNQRACYLSWLADGKNDPDIFIGYIFTYFYGLERRLLFEIPRNHSLKNERPLLLDELHRLIGLLEKKEPGTPYLNSLVNHINNLIFYEQSPEIFQQCFYQDPVPLPTYNTGMPLALQTGLAQMALDQINLPSDWALNWYLSILEPPLYHRTPAKRCYDEFRKLFALKYRESFENGIKITPNKTKWNLTYLPANDSLKYHFFKKPTALPDISRIQKGINQLTPLIDYCYEELNQYSRFLGKNPDKKETIDSLLTLPPLIWPRRIATMLKHLNGLLLKKGAPVSLKFGRLLKLFPLWESKTKTKMTSFLTILEMYFNIGMEPDCRYQGTVPAEHSLIVLFISNTHFSQMEDSTSNYAFAALIIHLNVLVCQADGQMSKQALNLLKAQIDRWPWLNPPLKLRLNAHLLWLKSQEVKISGVKKRLDRLTQSQKQEIGDLLIKTAQSDGAVSVEEVKILEKLFKLLKIEPFVLYNQMNQWKSNHTPSSNPVSMEVPQHSHVQLDMNKLAALKTDSEKVSSLLSEIFTADEEEFFPIAPTPKQAGSADKIWGLPATLAKFVRYLCQKPIWCIAELEQFSAENTLMLDGALEEINDAAFAQFDEPFTEDIETGIEINQDIAKEIKRNENTY